MNMKTVGNFDLLFWVSFIFCSMYVSLGYDPIDNYLIDCGSSQNTSVGNRTFVSDNSTSYTISNPESLFATTNSDSISSAYGSSLYRTARILNETTHYTFSIKTPGWHWIRLHFFPFVSREFNMSTAKFSVSVKNFTLIREYQPRSGPEVREYSLNISSGPLVLTFTPSADSFAFVNALEVLSLPDGLIPDGAPVVLHSGSYQNLDKQALETVFRVNMGNQTVYPQNDTLWRLWISDSNYLKHNNLGIFVSKEDAVNYTSGGPTPETAPRSVYGTATTINGEADPRILANVTWLFDVDPEFEYLVRFHFCNIVSPSPRKLFFNFYINALAVVTDFDLGGKTSNIFGAPYFMDVIVKTSESRALNVSIGRSTVDSRDPVAILNGLEIMKMNNSKGSLDFLDSEVKSSKSSSKMKVWVMVGIAAGVLFTVLVLALFLFLLRRIRRRKLSYVGNSAQDRFNGGGDLHTRELDGTAFFSSSKIGYRFPFVAIQEATDNFSENLVVGVGGFGKVYKGILRDEAKVAVKRGLAQSRQGLAEFRTEIEMLSQFRHRHLVSLIGYCDERKEMIIIYEYMENGTLKNHLYGSDLPALSWKQRLEICIGSARGLHYLHTGSAKAIIHRDVKSANILLDENLMAKVADFGLSKIGPEIDETHVSTAVKGSFGYLDPEYLTRQQLTEKSDVYSFGVVMLEVLCGRPVIDPSRPREEVNLVEWAMKWQRRGQLEEIIDPQLAGKVNQDSLKKFGDTAEKCLAEYGSDRPTMGDVLWNLEYALQLQLSEERPSPNGETNEGARSINRLPSGVSTAHFSMGSIDDIAGISMSAVFSELVKADMR